MNPSLNGRARVYYVYKVQHTEEDVLEEATSIRFKYVPIEQTEQVLHDKHLMALIDFKKQSRIASDDPRRITVGLAPLEPDSQMMAIFSREIPSFGIEGDVNYSCNSEAMFGYILLNEGDYEDIYTIAKNGYDSIVRAIKKLGFPELVRVWNFLPEINQEIADMERYRSFCTGRYETLISIEGVNEFPAASAIGSHGSGVLITFLAAKQAGLQVENPRQESAFKYPKQYGPTSPSFSRATLKSWGQEQHLYISGTASIVGYESKHCGDTLAQLKETLKNLESLIENCKTMTDIQVGRLKDLSLVTVYLRHEADYPMVKQHLDSVFDHTVPIIYLNGDICRKDLSLEVEAIYMGP